MWSDENTTTTICSSHSCQQKIQKLLCNSKYVKLESWLYNWPAWSLDQMYWKEVALEDHQGKLRALDENKMWVIEDLIKRVYRGKAEDVDKLWKTKCRTAIANVYSVNT